MSKQSGICLGSSVLRITLIFVAAVSAGTSIAVGEEPLIRLERVPDGGLQPQVAVDSEGVVHLVYFKGEPANGDLFYCRREIADAAFSTPIRVNSEPTSAIATGTIRGAQIAIGADQRVHVAWNGSSRSRPRGPNGETPLIYTRLNETGDGFEPQRNLIHHAYGLDGGACLAANEEGHVYVAWHAGEPSAGEAARRIWMVHSEDNGETFSEEQAIDDVQVGACGCCGMRGTVNSDGDVMFLYRSAETVSQRDIFLLASTDGENEFTSRRLQAWEIDACPMSSEAFAHVGDRTWGAWETDGQIFFTDVSTGQTQSSRTMSVDGTANQRKHPVMAANEYGQVLIVWTEGTGWNRGGNLAWQLIDENSRSSGVSGSAPGIPVWSFAAAYPGPEGAFVVLY